MSELVFSPSGPFDAEERALVTEVLAALGDSGHPDAPGMCERVRGAIVQLDGLGELLCTFPSLQREQELGSRRRGLSSLVDVFVRVQVQSLEMYLPTRALVARALVAGEMNFYRLVRFICEEALDDDKLTSRVEHHLCHCLHTRLAEMLFISIATDIEVPRVVRERAVISLSHVWEQTSYRVVDFFPLLEATWDARRVVPATLGTLMGTAEMFRLIQAGCDEQFVDYLVHPDRTADEEAAFREFLFGATTEHLAELEAKMRAEGRRAIDKDDAGDIHDACVTAGEDPALALFEFFLSRHLQATARRNSGADGPKRTAEEYVMLNFLEHADDADLGVGAPRA